MDDNQKNELRIKFLSDVLQQSHVLQENNWESWLFDEKNQRVFHAEQHARWLDFYMSHWDELLQTHEWLGDDYSRQMLWSLMLYRVLGHLHVKLPVNNARFWEIKASVPSYIVKRSVRKAWKFDLDRLKYKGIEWIGHPLGFVCGFLLKQYFYERPSSPMIRPEKGDVVIDAGGCWGDTALVFAEAVGEKGRVISFEFVPSNVALAKENAAMNPHLANRILVVEQPLAEISDKILWYCDKGPATTVSDSVDLPDGVAVNTITIDDVVRLQDLPQVDFIKMDIEGAEMIALEGAKNTIQQYKPKLAISIYHRPHDFYAIAHFIKELNSNYQLYLDHYTIFEQETVLYAIDKK